MARDFYPIREAQIVSFTENFRNNIAAAPGDFGLTPALAAQYAIAQQSFADMYTMAKTPSTRTPVIIAGKNAARIALEAQTRMLARLVRAKPDITSEQLLVLGLLSSANDGLKGSGRRRISRPTEAPRMLVSADGRALRVRLRDGVSGPFRKPPGVAGAMVYAFVADGQHTNPPDDLSKWTFMRSTTRTRTTVRFGSAVSPGTRVWLAACWFNPRMMRGPVSSPCYAHVGYGGPAMSGSLMKDYRLAA